MAVLASAPVCARPFIGAPVGSIKTVHGGQAMGAILRHSTKMGKVPSMVFDLELDDSVRFVRASGEDGSGFAEVTEDVTAHVQPQCSSQLQLCVDVEAAMQAGATDAAELARALSDLGYRALQRTALGGGRGNECLTNLRHTFLLCTPPSVGFMTWQTGHFIVDPTFRDCFEIAKPTPRYSAVLAAVPPVFIGTQECLASLVTLLCDEMKAAFLASGTLLAPWRQSESMLSKWQPRRSMDEAVSGWTPHGSSSGGTHATAAYDVPDSRWAGRAPLPPSVPEEEAEEEDAGCQQWRGCWVSDVIKESPRAAASQGRTGGLSMKLNSLRFSGGGIASGDRQVAAICVTHC